MRRGGGRNSSGVWLLWAAVGSSTPMMMPSESFAASADSPSEVAKDKYSRASRAYSQGRYADALLLLEEVRQLHKSPSALLLLGHCYGKLSRVASAVDAYREAERTAAAQIANGKDASGTVKEVRGSALEHMADLEPRVPYVTLALPADLPADFVLLLDGRLIPSDRWGLAMPLDPGGHEVAATGARMSPYKQSIVMRDGERTRIEVNPEREASAKVIVELPARVPISDAVLLVDGQKQSFTGPTTTLFLAPGPHAVVVKAPNRKTFLYSGGLVNGENILLRPSLRRSTPIWATIVAGGLGLVSIGLAIGFGAYAQNQERIVMEAGLPPLSMTDPENQTRETKRSEIRSAANASTSLFVIGAVFSICSLSLGLTADWSGLQIR